MNMQTDWLTRVPTGEARQHYPPGFFRWLSSEEGQTIWRDFERKALQMAAVRGRYSAMAIVQVIRWETNLQDGSEFKINNNWTPGLARIWLLNHGDRYPGFFQLRDGLGFDRTMVGVVCA